MLFKPNKLLAVVGYVISIFLLAGIITLLVAMIMAQNDIYIDKDTLIKSFQSGADLAKLDTRYIHANAVCQGVGNLVGYTFALIFVCFYLRDELTKDFKAILENKKFFFIYIPLVAILGTAIMYGIDKLVGLGVPESQNQSTITMIMENGGAWMLVISTVLCAPIVEELIYRKLVFFFVKPYYQDATNPHLKRFLRVLPYIISVLLFTLPHMVSTTAPNFGIWLLQCVPYASSGIILCLAYDMGKENIYASIALHMLNNILACILVFVV